MLFLNSGMSTAGRRSSANTHIVLALLALSALSPAPARADCSNPPGREAQLIYNADYHVPQFCNGADWIKAGLTNGAGGGTLLPFGYTDIGSDDDSGNGDTIQAQQFFLPASGSLQSLSFFVLAAAGNLRLALYDATGPSGQPGAKLAETATFTPTTGWNIQNVTTPVQLTAGVYWLAYTPSSDDLHFRINRYIGAVCDYNVPFGTMPSTFSPSANCSGGAWSFYANILTPDLPFGDYIIENGDDSGNANLLIAQKATLATAGVLQSLSFYVTTAAGNLRLGVYDATGPSGQPGAKLAETASFAPTTGWNTQNVTAPVALSPGTYWLAYTPSSNSLHFAVTGAGNFCYYTRGFAAMPATFDTNPDCQAASWSFYATVRLPTCANPAGQEGQVLYNADHHILQFCDGAGWRPVGTPGGASSSCASPTGQEGQIIYNGAYHTYQYCNGKAWIAFGK